MREAHRATFGPAEDRAGELQGGARHRLAGDDELGRHRDRGLGLDEHALDVLDHRRGDAGPAVLEAIPGVGVRRQFGADDEQLALVAEDQFGEPAEGRSERADAALDAEVRAGEPECGDGLVDRAVGLGPRVVLADPIPAVEEAGRAVVALGGRDDGIDRGAPVHHVVGRLSGNAVPRAPRAHPGRLTTSARRRGDPTARPGGSP